MIKTKVKFSVDLIPTNVDVVIDDLKMCTRYLNSIYGDFDRSQGSLVELGRLSVHIRLRRCLHLGTSRILRLRRHNRDRNRC